MCFKVAHYPSVRRPVNISTLHLGRKEFTILVCELVLSETWLLSGVR